MAMVLSQKTKMVCGALLTLILLGSVLVTGSALGWFSPGGSGETSGELAAKLSQRRLYGNQVPISLSILIYILSGTVFGYYIIKKAGKYTTPMMVHIK